jgi:hypothetical protein
MITNHDSFQSVGRAEKWNISTRDIVWCLYFSSVGITVFVFMLWITLNGVGVSPDSTTYLEATENLLKGNGFSVDGAPLTHYPPLYSILVAGIAILANELSQAARILCATLFALNSLLIALAIFITTERNIVAVILGVLTFVLSAPLLMLHSMAWSEPLFISFSLICVLLLSRYIVQPSLILFIASSTFLSLALMTRYIGIAFISAAFAMMVISNVSGQKLGHRIRYAALWVGIACAPLAIWLLRNRVIADSATNRKLSFHPFTVDYIKRLILTLHEFILPIELSGWVKTINLGLLMLLFFIGFLIFFKQHTMNAILPTTCMVFAASYVSFLLVSKTFFDAATPIDIRILSPIFVFLIISIFSVSWSLSRALNKTYIWWGFIIFIAISILLKTAGAIRYLDDFRENGTGYTSRQWQKSETIAFVKSLPENFHLYTNGPDVIGFLTGRESLQLPEKSSSVTKETNIRYEVETQAMCNDMAESGALLIYFGKITWRGYLPSEDEVISACQLNVIKHFSDGTVYAKK